jgi:hypothetical protein
MFVTKSKKLAFNEELVQTAAVTSDDSVVLAIGANAVTLEGDDAVAIAGELGLTTHAQDAEAAAKDAEKEKKHDAANAAHAAQQPVKK